MVKQIKKDTRSPTFENEGKRRLAALLHIFLLADSVILIIYTLISLLITPGPLFSWLFLGLFSLLVLGLLYQIVEHKRAEEAVRANAERLWLALDATSLVIWDWHSQTNTITWSDNVDHIFGLQAGQFDGAYETYLALIHPDDRARIAQTISETLAEAGHGYQVEHRLIWPDGSIHWLEGKGQVYRDETGRAVRMTGTAADITERKRLEQQIRESSERRGRQLQIAAQISQEMTVVTSKEQLYGRVVTLIKEQFGFYNTQLFRYEPGEQALVLAAGYGESGTQMAAAGYQVALGQGLIGAAAASGASILQPDVSKTPLWRPNPYLPQSGGELAIPIRSGRVDPQAQIAALQYFIENGVDGLIISVASRDLTAPITQKAVRQNIPVISTTSSTLGPEEQTAFVGALQHEMGYTLGLQAGAWAKAHVPPGQSLKVAIISYRSHPQLIEREEGIVAGLKQIFEGDLELIASEAAGDYSVQGFLVAEGWLKCYPDLQMILAINDVGALGAYQAVIAAGRDNPRQFFVGGIDAIEEALSAIKKGGAYQATVDINTRETGVQAVRCLVRAIKGLPYQQTNEIKPRPVNQANLETFLKQKKQAVSADPPPSETDLTGLDLSGVKIGLCIFSLANPFYVTLVKGARAEAERLGVELVINEARRILGVLAVQSDVAGALDAEDQLALEGVAGQIAVVLEKMLLLDMVEERTQALQAAQERLIRQEKLAVLGQLAGGVAHEIRNPLGVIANAIYFLRLTSPDADEGYLDLIADQIRDTEKIVSALLDFTHIRLPEREMVAVGQLVTDVLERNPPPEQVQVTTSFTPELPPVFVDATQIGHQVLANLVTNAYQAMPNGGELAISAHSEDGWVKLAIADTGVGMSPETMAKIFEPLFTTRAKGIGLGLAVSKNLVEVNDGTIEVKSVEGQGAVFTIILPTR